MIEVIGAVIVRNNRVLLTQRRADKAFPLLWESPGGKVEGNESHHDALRRELGEELGVEVKDIGNNAVHCHTVERPGEEDLFVILYPARLAEGAEPKPLEGQGLGWFTDEELSHLSLAPGNERGCTKIQDLMLSLRLHHEGSL